MPTERFRARATPKRRRRSRRVGPRHLVRAGRGASDAGEALAEEHGLLATFDSPDSIARCILFHLGDPAFRRTTEERTLAYGREMAGPRAGERYAALIRRIVEGQGADG